MTTFLAIFPYVWNACALVGFASIMTSASIAAIAWYGAVLSGATGEGE